MMRTVTFTRPVRSGCDGNGFIVMMVVLIDISHVTSWYMVSTVVSAGRLSRISFAVPSVFWSVEHIDIETNAEREWIRENRGYDILRAPRWMVVVLMTEDVE